jgi:hypothetical protein
MLEAEGHPVPVTWPGRAVEPPIGPPEPPDAEPPDDAPADAAPAGPPTADADTASGI